jgi:hypothetical protein
MKVIPERVMRTKFDIYVLIDMEYTYLHDHIISLGVEV